MTDNSVATTQSNPSDIRIESSNDSQNDIFGQIPPDELYKEAIKCYKGNLIFLIEKLLLFDFLEKEKSGELSVEYPLRLQFMAYSKQAKHGDYKDNAADYGWYFFIDLQDIKKQ
jgi:hypothetical protein